MPATKKWSDMTEQDILILKREQCFKCYYFSVGPDNKQGANNIKGICDYLAIEGHSRGCSQLECMGNGIFRKREKSRKRRVMRLHAQKSGRIPGSDSRKSDPGSGKNADTHI